MSLNNSQRKRAILWEEQGRKCFWCFQLISTFTVSSIDHWIPITHKSCGGSNSFSNLRLMHRACNLFKNNTCPICSDSLKFKWRDAMRMMPGGVRMTFDDFAQVIRDRARQLQREEQLDAMSAMLRVEEEVSAILGAMLDETMCKGDVPSL